MFRLTAWNASDPAKGFRAAFDRIADLDAKLSDYKPDSELNRLCRAGRAEVSDDLLRVLTFSQQIARETGGAFDITQGPVVRLWREARRTKRLPDPAALNDAADRSGHRNVTISGRRVSLQLRGMHLDLGGVAKGYAADEALAVLARGGIRSALVAASGDLAIGAAPPRRTGWTVGAGGASRVLTLAGCGVSTSGDAEQYVEIGGMRYSHIIDPHTHTPLTRPIQVTVVARRAMESDALATALSVMGPERGAAFVRTRPGVRAYF